jgi:hypothetical protein
LCRAHLDRGVLGDDAGAGAGRVQQHAVHAALAQHARQLAPVVVAHNCAWSKAEEGCEGKGGGWSTCKGMTLAVARTRPVPPAPALPRRSPALVTPMRWMLAVRLFSRSLLISLANRMPVLRIRAAR